MCKIEVGKTYKFRLRASCLYVFDIVDIEVFVEYRNDHYSVRDFLSNDYDLPFTFIGKVVKIDDKDIFVCSDSLRLA